MQGLKTKVNDEMKEIKERINHLDSELALLSCCLQDKKCFLKALVRITPEMFSAPSNTYLWQAMRMLFESNKEFDPISIMAVLTDQMKEALKEVGEVEFIEGLQMAPVNKDNLDLFIDHVLSAHAKRLYYLASKDVLQKMMENKEVPLNELIADVETKFRGLALQFEFNDQGESIGDSMSELIKDIANGEIGKGIPTGFSLYDELTGGLQPNELIVIGARSKIGKSILSLNWARHIALNVGLPVLYIDTEMTAKEQSMRWLQIDTQLSKYDLLSRKWMDDKTQKIKVAKALKRAKEAPFYHVSMTSFTPESVSSLIRQYTLQHGVKAVFFDYLKMPSSQRIGEKEHAELGRLASVLKDCANTEKIPVVAPVQLNRGAIDKEPTEGDVADSDRIFRYCTQLCFLYPKTDKQLELSPQGAGEYIFKLERQRHGMGGVKFDIKFNKSTVTMTEVGEFKDEEE